MKITFKEHYIKPMIREDYPASQDEAYEEAESLGIEKAFYRGVELGRYDEAGRITLEERLLKVTTVLVFILVNSIIVMGLVLAVKSFWEYLK